MRVPARGRRAARERLGRVKRTKRLGLPEPRTGDSDARSAGPGVCWLTQMCDSEIRTRMRGGRASAARVDAARLGNSDSDESDSDGSRTRVPGRRCSEADVVDSCHIDSDIDSDNTGNSKQGGSHAQGSGTMAGRRWLTRISDSDDWLVPVDSDHG